MPDSTTTLLPFEKVSDVDVVMTVIKPSPMIGLGNMLILNKVTAGGTGSQTTQATQPTEPAGPHKGDSKGRTAQEIVDGVLLHKTDPATGAVYREFKNADAVSKYYTDDSNPVALKATTYFAQKNPSDRVAVLDYPDGKLKDALGAFWFNNWTFAIFATPGLNDDTNIASSIFEVNKDHILMLQSEKDTDFLNYIGQDYTVGLQHRSDEALDAAYIGDLASLTVGSVNWKFTVDDLVGITPDILTVGEVKGLDNACVLAYIDVANGTEMTNGCSLSHEYIDSLHGDIWVKYNIAASLEDLLQKNHKLSYDAVGIGMIRGNVTTVLQKAFEQRIILQDENGKPDFSVSATPREQQSQKDISDRHYGGCSFKYHRSGAINTVTVYGTVQSDTITNNE